MVARKDEGKQSADGQRALKRAPAQNAPYKEQVKLAGGRLAAAQNAPHGQLQRPLPPTAGTVAK